MDEIDFIVFTASGSKRIVKANHWHATENGALLFHGSTDQPVALLAAGCWTAVFTTEPNGD